MKIVIQVGILAFEDALAVAKEIMEAIEEKDLRYPTNNSERGVRIVSLENI